MINFEANQRNMESVMIDVRKVLVADHIQELERDAAAHAGRRRARQAFARDEHENGRAATNGAVRVRVGRWLVGVGQAIAGPPATPADDARTSIVV